jgi:indole-3-glycerol phosphate synthase
VSMSRFSQAISEGDGISVIPVLEGDVEVLAEIAEAAGAEAVAVGAGDVGLARGRTGLPIIVRGYEIYRRNDLEAVSRAGADACIIVFDPPAGEGELLDELYPFARELGLDCAVDVRKEDELERVLERVDPDIVLISERELERDEEDLERTLDLLADVPAGKLVISDARVVAREQVVALERAGVDAVLVRGLAPGENFSAALEELAGGSGAHR